MQIACERCSTTYVLDDSLIPVEGAPVQCTKCMHVFTAKPPAPAAPRLDLKAPAPTGTLMFGHRAPPEAPASKGHAPAQEHSTQMFGAVSLPEPAPSTNSTLMFGANAGPGHAPVKAAAQQNSTQMFGAIGGPGPDPRQSATQAFGAQDVAQARAKVEARAGSSTMMFGSVPQEVLNARPSTGGAQDPKVNSTMMFGTPSVPAQPAVQPASQPMAQPSVQPSAPRAGSSTMMFGSVPPAVAQSMGQPVVQARPTPTSAAMASAPKAGSSTMMFGSVPAAVAATPAPAPSVPKAGSSTMMFGSVPPEVLAAQASGQPSVQPAAQQPVQPAASGPRAGSSTMMFGSVPPAVAAAQPLPEPVQPAPRAGSSTMMFGAMAGPKPEPEPEPEPEPLLPRSSSTQMFGAMSQTLRDDGQGQVTEQGDSQPQARSPSGAEPAWKAPPADPLSHPQGDRAPAPLIKPKLAPPQRGLTMEMNAYSAKLESQNSRSLLYAGLGLVGLVGLAVAFHFITAPKAPPEALVGRVQSMLVTAQKDDQASLDAADSGLRQLSAEAPANYLGAKSGHLLVLSLINSELSDQNAVLSDRATLLLHERKVLDEEHAVADYRARIAEIDGQVGKLKAVSDKIIDRVKKVGDEQAALIKELNDARRTATFGVEDMERAIGMYYSLEHDERGPKLADRYKKDHAGDGWAQLMVAAYGTQPRQTADQLKASLASADEALKADPRFNRARRIKARDLLYLHQWAPARAQAQELSLALPGDAGLKIVMEQIDQAEASAAKAPPRPQGP